MVNKLAYLPVYDSCGQEHYNFVRDGMMYEKNAVWDPFGDEGEGDTIGMSLRAGRSYSDPRFFEEIRKCWQLKQARNGKIILFGWRSNNNRFRMDMSRDHLANTIMMEHWDHRPMGVYGFYSLIPWRFSFGFKQTVDIYLWANALMNKNWARHLYYWWQVPQSLLSALWTKLWKLLLGVKKETNQHEFVANRDKYTYQHNRKKKWWWLIPPVYALLVRTEQLECMPKSIGKWLMCKILLWNVPRYNYVMKIILGAKVTAQEFREYISMDNGRWSTSLDIRCDRTIEFRKPKEALANCLDKDYLWFLFNKYVDIQ